MTLEKPLWICLVTKNNPKGLSQTLYSICKQIQLYQEKNIRLLLIDKSEQSSLPSWIRQNETSFQKILFYDQVKLISLEENYQYLYQKVNCNLSCDSIQRTRIQLMMAILENQDIFNDTIIWQIDDDHSFETLTLKNNQLERSTQRNFFYEARQFHRQHPHIDAAIGKCSFAPPIPRLLYIRKQLNDILNQHTSTITSAQENFEQDINYHDLYSSDEEQTCILPIPEHMNYNELIHNLIQGVPITRPVVPGKECPLSKTPEKNYLRGGNFIIFNLEIVLAFPHIAFGYQGFISRRSDMIHAWMLGQMGYHITDIDISLIHDRSFSEIDFYSIQQDYISDLLGAAVFRFLLNGSSAAEKRIQAHIQHLEDLFVALKGLKQKRYHPLLEELQQHVSFLKEEISSWNQNNLREEMQQFKIFIHSLLDAEKQTYA